MARPPQKRNGHSHSNEWSDFFFGSPKRFLFTSLGVFIIFAMVDKPDATALLANVRDTFVEVLGPASSTIFQIAVMLGAAWLIVRAIFGPGKGKNNSKH